MLCLEWQRGGRAARKRTCGGIEEGAEGTSALVHILLGESLVEPGRRRCCGCACHGCVAVGSGRAVERSRRWPMMRPAGDDSPSNRSPAFLPAHSALTAMATQSSTPAAAPAPAATASKPAVDEDAPLAIPNLALPQLAFVLQEPKAQHKRDGALDSLLEGIRNDRQSRRRDPRNAPSAH